MDIRAIKLKDRNGKPTYLPLSTIMGYCTLLNIPVMKTHEDPVTTFYLYKIIVSFSIGVGGAAISQEGMILKYIIWPIFSKLKYHCSEIGQLVCNQIVWEREPRPAGVTFKQHFPRTVTEDGEVGLCIYAAGADHFLALVTIVGGIVFLAFAFSALFIKPDAGFWYKAALTVNTPKALC